MSMSRDAIGHAGRPARGDICASGAVPGKAIVQLVTANVLVAGMVLERRTAA